VVGIDCLWGPRRLGNAACLRTATWWPLWKNVKGWKISSTTTEESLHLLKSTYLLFQQTAYWQRRRFRMFSGSHQSRRRYSGIGSTTKKPNKQPNSYDSHRVLKNYLKYKVQGVKSLTTVNWKKKNLHQLFS